ncbi:MAG: hypothetical protein J6C64_02025 [Lachnospiraceae bacterium]|nr:hypothetical protein [Lachnospiraceae bacterium]
MRILKSLTFTIIISAMLILVTAFCISGTVQSQSRYAAEAEEKYYKEMEEIYAGEIRAFLEEAGYRNSGIMMTRIIDEEGERSYTVTIHHDKLDKLSGAEKKELLDACSRIEFPDRECGFCHKFLEEDL